MSKLIQNQFDFDFQSKDKIYSFQKEQLAKLLIHTSSHLILKDRINFLPEYLTPENMMTLFKDILPIDIQDHKELLTNFEKDSAIVFSSGGTSGNPKITLWSFKEVMDNTSFHGKGYASAGINKEDIVATFGLPGIFSSEFTVYLGLEKTGCLILPIGEFKETAEVIKIIKEFKATVLLVMPSDLIPIMEYLEKTSDRLENIRLIVTGGEGIYKGFKNRINKTIGKGLIFRSTFQTSDTGTIGFQCSYLEDNEYHIHEELQIIEFEKDNDGESILVTTNLNRKLMPVIKLRTGDIAEPVDIKCPCGRNSKIIRLMGRKSKSVKIGGEKFDINFFRKVIDALEVPLNDCAFELSKNESHQDEITLKIYDQHLSKISLERVIKLMAKGNQKFLTQVQKGIISFNLDKLVNKDTELKYSKTGKRVLFFDAR